MKICVILFIQIQLKCLRISKSFEMKTNRGKWKKRIQILKFLFRKIRSVSNLDIEVISSKAKSVLNMVTLVELWRQNRKLNFFVISKHLLCITNRWNLFWKTFCMSWNSGTYFRPSLGHDRNWNESAYCPFSLKFLSWYFCFWPSLVCKLHLYVLCDYRDRLPKGLLLMMYGKD